MIKFVLLAICISMGAVGDVSVTRGMKQVGTIDSFSPGYLFAAANRTLRNGLIWVGVTSKAIALFSFLALLSRAELSWAAPAAASTFVVDTVAAKIVLRENINRLRWAGALLVCTGVALISV